MNRNRKIAFIVGTLTILATVAGVLSVVPAIDDADFLIRVSEHTSAVRLGALFQFIMAVAYIFIAVLLYAIIKKFNSILAAGYLSFRIISGVFNIIGVFSILLIVSISQGYSKTNLSNTGYFQVLGELLRAGRDLSNHVAMIVTLGIASIMFYCLMYQTKLIPRWMSSWGLAGTVLTMLASFLVMFGIIDIITPLYMLLNLPTGIQEITMAIWLVSKGFNTQESCPPNMALQLTA